MLNRLQSLSSPQWQRLRLEVLQAHDFKCQECGSGDDCLHVHHTFYEKGKPAWEYSPESLMVLCETCHETRAEQERMVLTALTQLDVLALGKLSEFISDSIHSCGKEKVSAWIMNLRPEMPNG